MLLALAAALSLLSLTLLSLALLSLALLPLALLSLLLSVLSALALLRRALATLTTLGLLSLLRLSLPTVLTLLTVLRLLALLVAAFGESTLRAGRALLLALAHALIHGLEAANEIPRTICRLRLLALSIAGLRRGLRLLEPLTEVGDVGTDLLLGGVQPIGGSGARCLLRVAEFLFNLAAAQRVGRALECP